MDGLPIGDCYPRSGDWVEKNDFPQPVRVMYVNVGESRFMAEFPVTGSQIMIRGFDLTGLEIVNDPEKVKTLNRQLEEAKWATHAGQ